MALSRGLPVLATNVGGLPEIIEDGVSGLLVEPNGLQGAWSKFVATDMGETLLKTVGLLKEDE